MEEMTRSEWLAERRNYLGASDVSAVLGASPYNTALGVYEAKITGYSQGDNDQLMFGRKVEAAVAGLYGAKTGRVVEDIGATVITVHPDIPWLGATLDRVIIREDGERGALECKHVGDPRLRKDDWQEEPPLQNIIQNQIQMACADLKFGTLAGMFPGVQLAHCDRDRDDNFLNAAYPKLEEFWKCVQDRTPPAPDSHRDLKVVKRLWSKADGETVSLDADKILIVDAWEKAKATKSGAEKDAKSLEATIRAVIGDAEFGSLPDGRMLSLKVTKRKAYTREVAAGEYRTLRMMKLKGK